MIGLAGDPAGFLGVRHRLGELAQLREAPGEPVLREDECPRHWLRRVRTADRPEASPRPGGGDRPRGDTRQSLCAITPRRWFANAWKETSPWADGEGESPLGQLERAVRVTSHPGSNREPAQGPPQPSPVAQCLGEGLGRRERARCPSPACPLTPSATLASRWRSMACSVRSRSLRDVPKRVERLLEVGRRLPVGRAVRRLPPGLPEIERRPSPTPRPGARGEPGARRAPRAARDRGARWP